MSSMPRRPNDLAVDFLNQFQALQSKISDVSIGSDLWNMARAVGKLGSEIETTHALQVQNGGLRALVGSALDRRANDDGVPPRKPAVPAQGQVVLRGIPGTNVPSGVLLRSEPTPTRGAENFTTRQGLVLPPDAGEALVDVVAQRAGESGNLPPMAINQMVTPIRGVTDVFNPSRTFGGANIESDDSLRERIRRWPETLRGGTDQAVHGAILSIPGVAYVSSRPRWPNPGDCTVAVSDSGGALSSSISAAAALLVQGSFSTVPPLQGVGAQGMWYFFRAPTRNSISVAYTAALIDRSTAAALNVKQQLLVWTTATISALQPGTRLYPSIFMKASQFVPGIQSIVSVSAVSVRNLEAITGVEILGGPTLLEGEPSYSAPLRYIASPRILQFAGGLAIPISRSGSFRLSSANGSRSIDISVDLSKLPTASMSELVSATRVQATGLEIGLLDFPVIGRMDMLA